MATIKINNDLLRVTCTCYDVTCNLDIWIWGDGMNDVSIGFQPLGFIDRVTAAWLILRGKPHCVAGIVAENDDLQEIADFINKKLTDSVVHK